MRCTDNISIVAVPPDLFGEVWPHAGGLLRRGLSAAELPVGESIARTQDGGYQLWVIVCDDPARLLAVCLTEITTDRGRRVVGVYALAGRGIRAWGEALSDRMAQYARDENCAAVRFCGRRALTRVYGKCRVVGELRPGVAIMERAA